jgi:hypothetical protein
VGRRGFLAQSAAVIAPGGLFASTEGPLLRAISSWKSSPDVGYFFAFDAVKFYGNIEAEMKAVSEAGFNTLYLIYHPYRSEDGRPTPWQDHIPLNDPDFASVPPPGPDAGKAEERTFQRILAACQKYGLKTMFNVGCWSPQKWFRENPAAISKLPDGSPQHDRIFLRSFGGKRILTPCFRSSRFISYTEAVVRTWLRQYKGSRVFEAVLPRVRVTDRFEVRLDPAGLPLFYIHQDTIDRDWCHCATCQGAFREYLRRRFGSIGRVNSELHTEFASLDEASIPLSPYVPDRGRFKVIDPVKDPTKKRLWYEAALFWSESIAGWRSRLTSAVREFYPDAEVMMISKYPASPFLTDYPLIARDGKLFLMDSYPMESALRWNVLRYFFDIEVYQSGAEQQGQTLVAHLQAYDNRLPNHVNRAPSPEEYRQQHIGLLGRRVGATVTLAFEHAAQLSPGGAEGRYLPDAMNIVRQWHRTLEPVEQAYRGATRYRGGVVVRYNPLENCNPKGAHGTFDRYKYWKDRGVPVRVVYDEKQASETVPDAFEFMVEGDGPRDVDLVVCEAKQGYLVSLTNLRATRRGIRLRVKLNGQDMRRWKVCQILGTTSAQPGDSLICKAEAGFLESVVFEVSRVE